MTERILPEGYTYLEHDGARLAFPVEWERADAPAGSLAVVHPEAEGLAFRPNVVVRVSDYAGSLPALAAFSLATTRAQINGCHFVAHDELDLDGGEGRRQRFAYAAGGFDLVVDRYLAVRGGRALEITVTATVALAYEMLPVGAVVAGSLDWDAAAVPASSGTRDAEVSSGTKEPRHDRWLSELAGHPIEDLSKLPAVQGYRSDGPTLSAAAVNLLKEHAKRSRFGRFDVAAHQAEMGELRAAGLIDAAGKFSPDLEFILGALREPEFRIEIGARHQGLDTTLDIHVGAGRALVLAGPSAPELIHGVAPRSDGLGGTPRGTFLLDLATTEGVPALIAAWAGLGPAWSVTGNVRTLEPGELERGCDAPLAVPTDADAASRRLLAQPWFGWSMTIPDLGFERTWLNAGAAGHYAVGALDDGGSELVPVASAQVWDVLLQEIGAATIARPAAWE
ncbi:hypothetical protein GCM10022377_08460 [Zhihengliuella alba]|uniref:Glycogen debranching enzyme N-terminal domain-containing protein n=1 Tax=Zhihengliuella alba TaxID=547018 RepID=A0ABP7CX79_9MICC